MDSFLTTKNIKTEKINSTSQKIAIIEIDFKTETEAEAETKTKTNQTEEMQWKMEKLFLLGVVGIGTIPHICHLDHLYIGGKKW